MTLAGTAALLGSKLLFLLPPRIIASISGPLSTLGWWLAKSRRRVALTNLRLCFPLLTETERETIARQHFRAYLQAAHEHGLLWNASAQRIRDYVSLHEEHEWKKFHDGENQRPVVWLWFFREHNTGGSFLSFTCAGAIHGCLSC